MNPSQKLKIMIFFSLLVLGISGISTQTILLREISSNLFGNELTIGIILSLWAIGIGLGSLLSAKFIKHRTIIAQLKFLSLIQIMTAFLVIISAILANIIKPLSNIPHYELNNLKFFFLTTFVSIVPISFLFGSCFVTLASIFSQNHKNKKTSPGYAYVIEALGAVISGIIFGYITINYLTNLQTACVIGILNIFCFVLIFKNINKTKLLPFMIVVLYTFSILTLVLNLKKIEQLKYGNEMVIKNRNSAYGNITITKKNEQYCLYSNGTLAFTSEDTEANEEIAHLIMLESPNPGNVLLIGGGIAGFLAEIIKHPVNKIDYLELDPLLIKTAVEFIPDIDKTLLANPKIHIYYSDARYFVKNSNKEYDVIIINSPDPINIQDNRFFTKEFFEIIKKHLKENGIFAFGISSKEDYISKEIAEYNACIYKTLHQTFQDSILLPSWKLLLISCQQKNLLTLDASVLKKRFSDRHLTNKFFNSNLIDYRLFVNKDRIEYVKNTITKTQNRVSINHDFYPNAFIAALNVWLKENSHFSLFQNKINLLILQIVLLLAIFLWLVSNRNLLLIQTIFTTGLTAISCEFVIIMAFQSIFGFLYYRLGIIISCFMAGIAWGGFSASRLRNVEYKNFKNNEKAIIGYLLMLTMLLSTINYLSANTIQLILVLFTILIGFLTGKEFPLGVRISANQKGLTAETTGKFYAFDILGAALGGILSSLIIFPSLGIFGVLVYLITLKLFNFVLLRKPLQ